MSLRPLISIIFSAILFGVSAPFAKILLGDIRPVALAGVLYLGVFLGLTVYSGVAKAVEGRGGTSSERPHANLEKRDLPWLAGAIVAGGIIGPICLMAGLSRISGLSASLLLNFEGLATALIAVFLFRENAGKMTWLALVLMTAAGVFLSWNPGGRLTPEGPFLVMLAMVAWGLDNNLTRQISDKDPVQIARIKGFVAGSFSTAAAFLLGQGFRPGLPVAYGLLVGALCFGLSLVLFIAALKGLGASRTGAFLATDHIHGHWPDIHHRHKH